MVHYFWPDRAEFNSRVIEWMGDAVSWITFKMCKITINDETDGHRP